MQFSVEQAVDCGCSINFFPQCACHVWIPGLMSLEVGEHQETFSHYPFARPEEVAIAFVGSVTQLHKRYLQTSSLARMLS